MLTIERGRRVFQYSPLFVGNGSFDGTNRRGRFERNRSSLRILCSSDNCSDSLGAIDSLSSLFYTIVARRKYENCFSHSSHNRLCSRNPQTQQLLKFVAHLLFISSTTLKLSPTYPRGQYAGYCNHKNDHNIRR